MEEQDEDLWSSSCDDRKECLFVEGGVIATLYSEILAFAIERKLPSQRKSHSYTGSDFSLEQGNRRK